MSEIPEGWKLVPITPSRDMVREGLLGFVRKVEAMAGPVPDDATDYGRGLWHGGLTHTGHEIEAAWAAMLEALPPPPLQKETEG